MFRIHFKHQPPRNYRETYASAEETRMLRTLLDHLFANGIMLMGTGAGALSTPMTDAEIETLCQMLPGAFAKVKKDIPLPSPLPEGEGDTVP